MPDRMKRTLATRFAFYVVSLLLFIGLLVAMVNLFVLYKTEIEKAETGVRHIKDNFVSAMTMSLWLTDHASLEKQLEQLALFPNITRVAVVDDEGTEHSAGGPVQNSQEIISEEIYYTKGEAKIFLGTLYIYFDTHQMKRNSLGQGIKSFFLLCASALFLGIIITLLFQGMIGKPLSRLAAFLQGDTYSKMSEHFNLGRKRKHIDELSYLIDSLNSMRANIGAYIEDKNHLETELSRANVELQKTLLEKDRYLSILAHDLRSPFSGFLSLTATLYNHFDTLSEDQKKEAAEELMLTAERVYYLLENLLEWSMIERGMVSCRPEILPLKDSIGESCDLFSHSMERKDIHLIYSVPEDITVYADIKMFESIMRNLIGNAVKFTDPGGAITVSADREEDMVRISVADSGTGMDRETLTGLFSDSPAASKSGSWGERGSGLGLLLCRDFIEKQGGSITAESTPGKGTKILFTLPHTK